MLAGREAHYSDVLKSEIAVVTEVVGCISFADYEDVLDADTKAPVGVVTGLCGYAHEIQTVNVGIECTV